MCKRRATPLLSTPPRPVLPAPGRPPAPQPPPPPRPLRAPRAPPPFLRPVFPRPHLHALLLLFQTLQQVAARRADRDRARGGGRRALPGPRAHPSPPAPAASRAPFSPHEQRSRGLALHLGAAVPRSPSLELVPCGASHRCEFPLRPGGVRRLTGTMWLGVVRSRHVPHEGGVGGGRREKRRAGARDGGGWAAKLFLFLRG